MTKQIIRCERCNEILIPKNVRWLELSIMDGNYYNSETFPIEHKSQGCFSFGTTCAKIELKQNEN